MRIFHRLSHRKEYKDNQELEKYCPNIKIGELNLMIWIWPWKNQFEREWPSTIPKSTMTSNCNKLLPINRNPKKSVSLFSTRDWGKRIKEKVNKYLSRPIIFKVRQTWVAIITKNFSLELSWILRVQDREQTIFQNRTRKINKRVKGSLVFTNTELNN